MSGRQRNNPFPLGRQEHADAYVQRITASQHDAGVVYVAYENHQNGDFKPYLIKSADKGKTWTSISGNLPERGGVYAIAEDHKDSKLLFAGTEFGLYFTKIGGEKESVFRAGGNLTGAIGSGVRRSVFCGNSGSRGAQHESRNQNRGEQRTLVPVNPACARRIGPINLHALNSS